MSDPSSHIKTFSNELSDTKGERFRVELGNKNMRVVIKFDKC